MTQTQDLTRSESLKQRWDALLEEQPRMRIRNAAQALGVSEAELLATRVGDGVTRLRPEHRAILKEVGTLGRVMALSRNADVVHERKGEYLNGSLEQGPAGMFVGADIDLRIFWHAWATAFAVMEEGKDAPRYSLQFFAHDGSALHKIYLLPESDASAYQDLVERFRAEDQDPVVEVRPAAPPPAERPDSEVDVAAFQAGWLGLKDTHDFFLLLRTHGVTRTQALRLAPKGHATALAPSAFRAVITAASERAMPIMVFVANSGMVQIHTGPVQKLVDIPEWFNVTDPDFNLHVREAAIVSAWVVRKPTTDGIVTALECYDAQGTQIVQLFGARKPGIPEREDWRALIAEVEARTAHV
ncbi:MAG: ChuX/HutX family heme-like substrate-binding protein [Flavobacteriales bacterium]